MKEPVGCSTEDEAFFMIAVEGEKHKNYANLASEIKYKSEAASENDLQETSRLFKNRKVFLLRSVRMVIKEEVVVTERDVRVR